MVSSRSLQLRSFRYIYQTRWERYFTDLEHVPNHQAGELCLFAVKVSQYERRKPQNTVFFLIRKDCSDMSTLTIHSPDINTFINKTRSISVIRKILLKRVNALHRRSTNFRVFDKIHCRFLVLVKTFLALSLLCIGCNFCL